ncbi:MAG: TIGR04076 family protein [Bacillota bacterium]|jgi:uncharacterized repeat protein (TIGR04076 family)
MKDVLVSVVSQKGTCGHGHAVGDVFRCGGKTPAGMCAAAYAALYPTIRALAAGGTFPWAEPDGSLELACPDGENPVIFRLKAV